MFWSMFFVNAPNFLHVFLIWLLADDFPSLIDLKFFKGSDAWEKGKNVATAKEEEKARKVAAEEEPIYYRNGESATESASSSLIVSFALSNFSLLAILLMIPLRFS